MKKRILSLILAAGLLMSGCSTGKKQETIAIDDSNFFDFNQYKDCDDIPDWKGEKVNLVVWGSVNSPNDSAVGKIASDDVVTPEIERITGVTFDKLNSYDNGGGSYDSQIAK